jgi:phosphoribosylglycinamide formyltransferase 1
MLREDAAVSAFRIVVLASGTGTNLQAILDTLHGREGIEVVGVGSDQPGAKALDRAREARIETGLFPRKDYSDRDARDAAMAEWIESLGTDLIALAGYMQLLSPAFVARFRNRIVNVHPALLPAFPGIHVIEQALEYGVKVAGVTVHFVDEGVDSGAIILQRAFDLPYSRDIAVVEQQVHQIEHELLPQAVSLIARGKVSIDPLDPRWVVIDE